MHSIIGANTPIFIKNNGPSNLHSSYKLQNMNQELGEVLSVSKNCILQQPGKTGGIISNEKVETYSSVSACQLMQDIGTKYSLPDI